MTKAPERIWVDDEASIGGVATVFHEEPCYRDPYTAEYIRADLARPMTVAEAAKDKSAERDIVTNIINSGTDHDGYLFSPAETADAILAALKARALSQGGE